jgi:hypothetical protein
MTNEAKLSSARYKRTEREDQLLSAAEREMVAQTRSPTVSQMSRAELEALGKRLRTARGRASRTTLARDYARSLGKTAALNRALKRVTAALRKLGEGTRRI